MLFRAVLVLAALFFSASNGGAQGLCVAGAEVEPVVVGSYAVTAYGHSVTTCQDLARTVGARAVGARLRGILMLGCARN